MKTLHFLFVALLIAGNASAQFFQRVYGGPQSSDVLESGMNYNPTMVPTSRPGYVMCGFTDFNNSPGAISPMVTRTNLAGAPVFNYTYYLFDFSGRLMDAAARRVITYTNGQIGVIGDFSHQTGMAHTQAFYLLLNANGTVVNVWTYAFQNVRSIEATSITPSVATAQQNAYACGNITDPNGRRYPFIMSIQAFTGILNWGYDYADVGMSGYEWTVEDLIESPYPNFFTGGLDVALVGRHVRAAGAFGDGNLFTVDAVTGAVSSFVHLYGTPNSEDNFNAIIIANNPFNGGAGYAIAGSTMDYAVPAPNSNMWGLKVAPNGAVQFSSQMDYSLGNRNDYGYDILERRSPTYGFQYFVGGYVDQGVFGREDEVVYKLDVAGNPYGGLGGINQFTYGGPGYERILQMDYYENGFVPANNVGLSAFNWTTGSFPAIGQFDFYHVKSYFNGVTPLGAVGGVGNCNYDQQRQHWMRAPQLFDSTKGDTVFVCKKDSLQWRIDSLRQRIICLQNGPLGGGDNMRLANSGDLGSSGANLFPNPVSRTNPLVNLVFDTPGYGDNVEIELYNSLGQAVMHKRETLGDGQTTLQVNLGDGLSAGVYSLVVRREGELTTHKISVE
jgi:hypothetical protein